jgi:hypothetical protein
MAIKGERIMSGDAHHLTAFIAARLDEDERILADALNGYVRLDADQRWAAFIEHFDESRALREVKAKRLLLRMLISALLDDPADETAQHQARLLAEIYSEHVDWRKEWRPDVY